MDEHSASTPATAGTAGATAAAVATPLPRRYRIALAGLCLACGVVAGLLAFTVPVTPSTALALAGFLTLGSALGLVAFRALEHSLE